MSLYTTVYYGVFLKCTPRTYTYRERLGTICENGHICRELDKFCPECGTNKFEPYFEDETVPHTFYDLLEGDEGGRYLIEEEERDLIQRTVFILNSDDIDGIGTEYLGLQNETQSIDLDMMPQVPVSLRSKYKDLDLKAVSFTITDFIHSQRIIDVLLTIYEKVTVDVGIIVTE